MKLFKLTVGVVLAAAGAAGCVPQDGHTQVNEQTTGGRVHESVAPATQSTNGLSSINGLISPEGQMTLSYIIRCALPASHTITMKDLSGNPIPFNGELGMAPSWEYGACNKDCQEQISACVLAHVNTTGIHIPLWLDGDSPALGWGQSPNYPQQEGSFFGNLFVSPPTMYYCNGKDFDVGVVPGRIGANQTGAPYKNAFGGNGYCKDTCTPQDSPNQNDGFKACAGWNHVVTVWRNATGTTTASSTSGSTTTASYYRLVPQSLTGSSLEIINGATANGTLVQMSTTATVDKQAFALLDAGSGNVKLALKANTAKCLGTASNATANSTLVQVQDCNGSSTQAFTKVTNSGKPGYWFKNVGSGRCLDVRSGGLSNGSQLQIYDCVATGNNQYFSPVAM